MKIRGITVFESDIQKARESRKNSVTASLLEKAPRQALEINQIKATGEPNQDYDKETFDAICKQLKKAGFQCSHREFDKYQGVFLTISKKGKLIDKFWIAESYVRGKQKADPNVKYQKAYLMDEEGGQYSANAGDYFNLPKDHVFKDQVLVLKELSGKEIEIENPKVSDLPDLSEIQSGISFEGTPSDVIIFYPESDPDMLLEVVVSPEGVAEVDELLEYCRQAQPQTINAESEAAEIIYSEDEAQMAEAAGEQVLVFDNEGKTLDRYTVAIKDGMQWDIYTMSANQGPQGVNQYSNTLWDLKPLRGSGKKIDITQLPEQVKKAIEERKQNVAVKSAEEKSWEDQMPGGLADEKTPCDFDMEALVEGIEVEMEHTEDLHQAAEIAMDHLTEDPMYYKKLKEIEPEAEEKVAESAADDSPRVYVSTYGKYNDGSLAGKWMNLDDYDTKEDFYEAAKELHKDEEDPEFMFQDYENFPEQFYSESGLPDELWDWLAMDEQERDLIEAYGEVVGKDYATLDKAEEAYSGTYDSKADWASDWLEETGGLSPDQAAFYLEISDTDRRLIDYLVNEQGIYSIEDLMNQNFIRIDYDAYARDAELNGDIHFVKKDGQYMVFLNV